MGRTAPSGLQDQLDLASCETQTTLDLYLADESEIHIATKVLTIDGRTYTDDLRTCNQILQTILSPPDRVTATVQNVDKVFGGIVTAETLVNAVAVVGRYYDDEHGIVSSKWVELFRGVAFPLNVSELAVQIEVLSDLVAAGHCVGDWTLAESCQFKYKDEATCGYSGGLLECNKKRNSPYGCSGHFTVGVTTNEFHFGGMEYPDIQPPSAPSGTGGFYGSGHHMCPRKDQFVPIRSRSERVGVKRAGNVIKGDEIYNPISQRFERVKSAEIRSDQPIWEITTASGAKGYSSFTHPILPYREHMDGLRVTDVIANDPVLLFDRRSAQIYDNTIVTSRDTGTLGDVVEIELEKGHIYAYGDQMDELIACHNTKNPNDLET